jgi:hypothetical protein
VWGDANITVPIRLHDTTRSVTTNLGLALRYLRLAEQERIIWVDALCIHQEDNLEKNHQVRQMGKYTLVLNKSLSGLEKKTMQDKPFNL